MLAPLFVHASLRRESDTQKMEVRYILSMKGVYLNQSQKKTMKNYRDTTFSKICLAVMVEWEKQLSCAVRQWLGKISVKPPSYNICCITGQIVVGYNGYQMFYYCYCLLSTIYVVSQVVVSRPCCRGLKISNRLAGCTFCCLFRYKMGL